MLIAILVIEAIKMCLLGILVYHTWPTMTVKEAGWIEPKKEEPEFEDDSVVVLTEERESKWLREQEEGNG